MGGKSDDIVVGYWYAAGFHYCLCYGPVDAVLQFRADDRVAWTGSKEDTGEIRVFKPDLFGGESREGGLDGTLKVKMGKPDQGSADMPGSGTGPRPAYRGVLSLIWQGYYAAFNPYMRPWAFKVKRILKGWYNDSVWYPEKAVITIGGIDNMNPAHILYQCLTDPEWGMGYPTSAVDDASFTAAADTLYSEAFGMSLTWNQQGQVKGFIGEVLDHILGVVRHDPQTGQFVLKLVRDDYDAEDLDEFDPSMIVDVEEYSRVSWGETINEVTVKYTDQQNGRVSAVTVHDIANIASQGAVISKTQQYVGIGGYALAQKVAMRDLKMASSPLARFKLKINRMAWRLLPGDVFKVSFPKLGIESVILRIMDCSLGTLDSNVVTVSAIEDVFALPSAVYIEQEPIGWEDPSNEPAESPTRYVTEAPYWSITRRLSRADMAVLEADDCYLSVVSEKPSDDALSYKIWTRTGTDDYVQRGTAAHCPTASLVEAIGKTDETIDIEGGVNLDVVTVGGFAYIVNSGDRYEAVRVDAISDDSITVKRGVLDTVPVEHDAGARILFAQNFEGTDSVTYLPTETVDTKIQTRTGRGELNINTATVASATMAQRQNLPYPPGLFRINGELYPASILGELTVSWAHRDRLQQTATIVDQDEASIGPEAGTTYTLKIYGDFGALKHTITGLTGTTYTLAEATEKAANSGNWNTYLRPVLTTVRDSLESWTSHDHMVTRSGLAVYDPDATALFARFTTDPGSTRKILINDFIVALKAAGVWAKLDFLYVYAAHEHSAALFDWRRATKAGVNNGFGFTVDTGVVGPGLGGYYVTTDYNPVTDGTNYARNNAALIVSAVGAGSDDLLIGHTAVGQSASIHTSTGTAYATINSSFAGRLSETSTSTGFWITQRTGSTASALYKDGTKVDGSASASAALLNDDMFVGMVKGSVGTCSATIQLAAAGESLNKDQRNALKAAFDTYMAGL